MQLMVSACYDQRHWHGDQRGNLAVLVSQSPSEQEEHIYSAYHGFDGLHVSRMPMPHLRLHAVDILPYSIYYTKLSHVVQGQVRVEQADPTVYKSWFLLLQSVIKGIALLGIHQNLIPCNT